MTKKRRTFGPQLLEPGDPLPPILHIKLEPFAAPELANPLLDAVWKLAKAGHSVEVHARPGGVYCEREQGVKQ